MTVAPQQLYTFRSSYTTLTYSKDDLRGLIGHIEESFTHSDIYIQALKRLQERLGSQGKGLQLLVNALGREAIRLTLRELISSVTQPMSAPIAPDQEPSEQGFSIPAIQNRPAQTHESLPPTIPQPNKDKTAANHKTIAQPVNAAPLADDKPNAIQSDIASTHIGLETQLQNSPNQGIAIAIPDQPVLADELTIEEAPATLVEEIPVSNAIAPPLAVPPQQPQKISAPKVHPQPSTDREQALSKIGQALYKARHQKNISIEQLHQRTCVPSHHIRALEDGIWHNLPEDIYLRGFIRLLGNAVDLNGNELSQPLADQQSNATTGRPTLSRASTKVSGNHQSSHINQTHLYLGYAALMAGATGGLAWMVSQPTSLEGAAIQTPDAPNQLSHLNQHNPDQGSFKVLATRIFEQINAIATPETLPPETPPSHINP